MVTKVKINPGICRFSTVVKVEKQPSGELKIDIYSGCPNLDAFKEAVKLVKKYDAINLPKANAILKAGQLIPHSCCAIPIGVIKACEVEIKFALKSNVQIEFMSEEAKEKEEDKKQE